MRRTVERRTRAKTISEELRAKLFARLAEEERAVGWPLVRFQQDPVAFARDVLNVKLKSHQQAILWSILKNEKTAVRSGQKTGKTLLVIVAALWFFSCFPKARVIVTANTKDQVRNVLWKELRDRLRESKVPIPGKWSDNPSTGFRSEDGREIFGITARDIESFAGVSGGAMLFICDEASALAESKAQALEGNRAGSGTQRMAWISNPTRAEGPFFDAFNAKKAFWSLFHLSSEDVAREAADTGEEVPGMANAGRIAQWAEEYGRDSPFYRVRVLGNFLLNEGGKAITLHMIQIAQEGWPDAEETGLLKIGLDPSGPGDGGDESAFAILRGYKLLALFTFHGLSEDGIIEHLLGFLKNYRKADEIPEVVVDSEGPIGGSLFGRLRAISENLRDRAPSKAFDVYGVRASFPARREPFVYDRVRDELIANLARWMRDGGTIPPDHKLEIDLHAADWIGQVNGKLKLTAKEDIREKIGRSPDRRDALALAVWTPYSAVEVLEERKDRDPYVEAHGGTFAQGESMDVHRSNEWWQNR